MFVLKKGAMSQRAELDTVCPNNHNLTLSVTQDEFEAALKSDSFVLHCNTCDANWPPSREDIESIRKQFAKS
jgi:hypothetical protein